MHFIYVEFRNGGWSNVLIVFLGLFGVVAGLAAALMAAIGGRAARPVGVVAVGLAVVVLSLGALGVMMNHRTVDHALAGSGISETTKERIEREGYLEAKSCAKFGLGAAVVPLLGGVAAIFLPRKREGEASAGLALPGAMMGFAVLVAAGDVALVLQKLPGRDYAEGDPIWQLLEAEGEIEGGRVTDGCKRLESSLGATGIDGAVADPSRVPDFPRVAGVCIDARIDAALAGPASERRGELSAVLASRPEMLDEAHKKRVAEELAKLPPLPNDGLLPDPHAGEVPPGLFGGLGGLAGGATGPGMRAGEISVHGRLPPEVIQRILRQHSGQFRKCYDTGLARNPALAGDVRAKFVIDRQGAVPMVADGGSTLSDAAVVACVLGAIGKLTFPQPEGGLVTVVYPIRFTAAGPKP